MVTLSLQWFCSGAGKGERMFLGHQLPTFSANTAPPDLTSWFLSPSPYPFKLPLAFLPVSFSFPLFSRNDALRWFDMPAARVLKNCRLLSYYEPAPVRNIVCTLWEKITVVVVLKSETLRSLIIEEEKHKDRDWQRRYKYIYLFYFILAMVEVRKCWSHSSEKDVITLYPPVHLFTTL